MTSKLVTRGGLHKMYIQENFDEEIESHSFGADKAAAETKRVELDTEYNDLEYIVVFDDGPTGSPDYTVKLLKKHRKIVFRHEQRLPFEKPLLSDPIATKYLPTFPSDDYRYVIGDGIADNMFQDIEWLLFRKLYTLQPSPFVCPAFSFNFIEQINSPVDRADYRFGDGVDLFGNYAIVELWRGTGAPDSDLPAHMFYFNGTSWEEQSISFPTWTSEANFITVTVEMLSDSEAIIVHQFHDVPPGGAADNSGGIHLLTRSGTTWSHTATYENSALELIGRQYVQSGDSNWLVTSNRNWDTAGAPHQIVVFDRNAGTNTYDLVTVSTETDAYLDAIQIYNGKIYIVGADGTNYDPFVSVLTHNGSSWDVERITIPPEIPQFYFTGIGLGRVAATDDNGTIYIIMDTGGQWEVVDTIEPVDFEWPDFVEFVSPTLLHATEYNTVYSIIKDNEGRWGYCNKATYSLAGSYRFTSSTDHVLIGDPTYDTGTSNIGRVLAYKREAI